MRVRSVAMAIAAVGSTSVGCTDITFDGDSGCSNEACQEIYVNPNPIVLLLGDTVGVDASNGSAQTDFTWDSLTPAVAQAGQPTFRPGLFGNNLSHVVVTGLASGTTTIVARRKSYSGAATLTVIPPSSLASFTLKKNRCQGIPAAWCEPVPPTGAPDTVRIGDTITVGGSITDLGGRTVAATITWTSSDPGVMEPIVAANQYQSVRAVAAKAVGAATVRGTVAGLVQNFHVIVLK